SALRLLEERETRMDALRHALVMGERSGESAEFDVDEFLARKRSEPFHR
ncbi:MAG: antitoxin ParD1/3/4, partial [Mycobacterium sp.]|nr:antitoxin ParD1/3/4 [Mycobacterium sp.]